MLLRYDMEGELLPGQVVGIPGSISKGFEYVDGKFVIISDREVYGFSRKKRPAKRKRQSIDPFTDLKVGDYVVHENHGIGKYLGIEKLTVGGQRRDYLNIQYLGPILYMCPPIRWTPFSHILLWVMVSLDYLS